MADDVAADFDSAMTTLTLTEVDADHFTVMTHRQTAHALSALLT